MDNRKRTPAAARGAAGVFLHAGRAAFLLLIAAALVINGPRPARAQTAESAARGDSEPLTIAPLEVALTFARTGPQEDPRVVAVTAYRDGRIEGIDLSNALGRTARDPIDVFSTEGYDGLRAVIAGAPPRARLDVPARDLVTPVGLRDRHIAAGTNFPEHAGEAEVEGGPFLFAKLVVPTGPYADVPAANRLLDYEAELAWVTLEPLPQGSMPEWMGLILCNDFTDRETLLRHIDPWEPESAKGFTTGKSFAGYLPVGNLFVIPRDYRGFGAAVDLHLSVNGELRQQARVEQAIWQIDELVEQIWAWSDIRWEHRGDTVSLLDGTDTIRERTLILSGTPSGTVFQGVSRGQMARGVASWLFGGWSRSIPEHAIDAYVADARAADIYLKPGDRVLVQASRMGVIDSKVVP